jgi:hypothetical protein
VRTRGTVVCTANHLASNALEQLAGNQPIGSRRPERHGDSDSADSQFLGKHAERGGPEASSHEKCVGQVIGHLPAVPERANEVEPRVAFEHGQFASPPAEYLIHDLDVLAVRPMDRERAPQNEIPSSGNAHVHELSRGDMSRYVRAVQHD